MIKVLSIAGARNESAEEIGPDQHWVKLVFENDHGVHALELNGTRALPAEPTLRCALEWMLWDYGLLEQQDSKTSRQRVHRFQELLLLDRRNHLAAKAYMERLDTSFS